MNSFCGYWYLLSFTNPVVNYRIKLQHFYAIFSFAFHYIFSLEDEEGKDDSQTVYCER